MTPRFSISVLAHQNIDYTKRCIQAVLEYSNDYELILTNNGSTDGTREYFDELARLNSNISVQHNAENLGFQKPNINALEKSKGEFFVLLNNDVIVCRNWLKLLHRPFIDDPNCALTGPNIGCYSLDDNFVGFHGKKMEYIEGCCLMGYTNLLRKHGLFDPNLKFAYGEDSDLSLRMRELGYSIQHVQMNVIHFGGRTSRLIPEVQEIFRKNHEYLKNKWSDYLKTRTFKVKA